MRRRLRLALRWAACACAFGLLAIVLVAAVRSRFVSPAPSLLLRDREGRFLGELAAGEGGEFGYWPLETLPSRVVAATLAVEDRHFRSHHGVDFPALARALSQNVRHHKRISGASTVAMQVARMQHPGSRSYPRKATEALSALFMTLRYGREQVLAEYLRIVPYGNRIHGIAYAARRYLDKPVEDLSWAETAFLAAIPQSPASMNPFVPSGRWRASRRGERILDRLFAEGVMTREEHALARQQIVSLAIPPVGERPRNALHFVLRLQESLGSPQARPALARRPIVKTTLDLDMQEEVAWLTYESVKAWEAEGAGNAAVVVLDRRAAAGGGRGGGSEVRAWVGSTDYFDTRHSGSIDYARVSRSPGSALKPFLYALALERGAITPATVLDDIDRGAGGIVNADGLFLGPMLPRAALANSRNVPAADLLARMGLDEGYGFLRDLGLHRGIEPARRYGLGLAIGGMPVTLEDLVRAYEALGSEGWLSDLVWYDAQQRPRPRRVFSEDTARQVTLFLSDPMARLPSFARMGAIEYPFPVAVKTGTSSRFRDAWTVAYSTRYLVGVWVGDPGFRPMNRLTGYRSAAELAQRVLVYLHHDQTDGLEDLSFPPPRGFRPVRLCALSGRRATAACDHVLLEWLRPGEEPVDECPAHIRLAVDTEVRTFVDLPARYASWAAAAGLRRPPGARAPRAPGASVDPTIRVSVTSPENGVRLLRDPETPGDQATLALKAVVDPRTPQVVWYVDGAPFQVVDYPYTARWRLRPGEHVFQARLTHGTSSGVVRVSVE